MKIIFLPAIALLMLTACNESEKNEIYNENNTNVINGVVYNINEKPINGVYKTYDEHGNVRMKITSKDGKPHGMGYFFRENGSLQYEAEFKDGILDGQLNQYYVNGALHNEMHYVKGIHDGVQKTFDSEGNQTAEIVYENGKPVSGFVLFNNEQINLTDDELTQIAAEEQSDNNENTDSSEATDETQNQETEKMSQ